VLSALVARVSGKSLGEFMRERLFEPLAMKDTAFWVPAEKMERCRHSIISTGRKTG
jgi:CubicO group peptidase (beta-lactamase class C family)